MTYLLLRLRYGFEMTNAYLAQMMGDELSMNLALDRAYKIARDIELIELNRARSLFD